MLELFSRLSENPFFLFWSIVAFAWLWEDGALIGAALLAANNDMSIPYAVTAVFVGICSGDLGLYYLGILAKRWRGLRIRFYRNKNFRRLSRTFKTKTFSNILLIRFVPGLRTIGFSLCGLWGIPLMRFLSAMLIAAVIWIALLFTLVYMLGTSEWLVNSNWKWGLGFIALVLLLANNFSLFFKKSKT